MSVGSEEYTLVEEMTVITEPAGKKDETYYWADNVTFLVEGTLFRVSPYPFVIGSKHFVERYGLPSGEDRSGAERVVVRLEGVTASQFRVLLKFLFPVHLTSTTSTFTKDEWLTILRLSTLWHFHDARKLAIQHLDGQLSDIELVTVGRAAYVPRWVLSGYRAIVERPRLHTLAEDIGDAIGYREVNRLWAIRYHRAVFAYDESFVGDALKEKFGEEMAELAARELEHRTEAEVKRDAQDAEEGVLREEEARDAGQGSKKTVGMNATNVGSVDGSPKASSSGATMVGPALQVSTHGTSGEMETGVFKVDDRDLDNASQVPLDVEQEAKTKSKRERMMGKRSRLARSRAMAAAEPSRAAEEGNAKCEEVQRSTDEEKQEERGIDESSLAASRRGDRKAQLGPDEKYFAAEPSGLTVNEATATTEEEAKSVEPTVDSTPAQANGDAEVGDAKAAEAAPLEDFNVVESTNPEPAVESNIQSSNADPAPEAPKARSALEAGVTNAPQAAESDQEDAADDKEFDAKARKALKKKAQKAIDKKAAAAGPGDGAEQSSQVKEEEEKGEEEEEDKEKKSKKKKKKKKNGKVEEESSNASEEANQAEKQRKAEEKIKAEERERQNAEEAEQQRKAEEEKKRKVEEEQKKKAEEEIKKAEEAEDNRPLLKLDPSAVAPKQPGTPVRTTSQGSATASPAAKKSGPWGNTNSRPNSPVVVPQRQPLSARPTSANAKAPQAWLGLTAQNRGGQSKKEESIVGSLFKGWS